MRDGLILGIRLQDGSVLDNAPIRRLSRAQVRWLLLAVRRVREHLSHPNGLLPKAPLAKGARKAAPAEFMRRARLAPAPKRAIPL
jgi:predicted acylesterase/phospholipase RssA